MQGTRSGVEAVEQAPLVFADVYAEHFPFVYRVVARLVGSGDSEDLVQEVFVVVHRRLHEFRGDARLTSWLFRIAYLTVGAHVRRERLRRRVREVFGREPEPSVPHPSEELERARRVRAALERLSFEERSALVLFEVAGLSGAEIAEALGVPSGTIFRRLHDARRAFAAAYAPFRKGEP
jgi:RNA polymerase sigma-70 factor (ECF subfamily)